MTYRASSATYHESSGEVPVPVCPTLPEGVHPANVKLDQLGGEQANTLYDEPTSPEYQELAVQFPECMDGSCMLDLRVDGASCFEGLTDCAEWITEPERDSKYSCRYGTHDVPLDDCYIYGQLFKPGVAAGNSPWADPTNGGAVPGRQAPTTSDNIMGEGVAGADVPRECWPSGWAVLNPVEWVLRPVQCALEWAFVPSPASLALLQDRAAGTWADTTLAKTIWTFGMIGPALSALDDGSCAGIVVDLGGIAPDVLDLEPQRFLPACPGDFFHPWAIGIHAFLILTITVLGFLSVKAQISRFVSNGEA